MSAMVVRGRFLDQAAEHIILCHIHESVTVDG